MSEEKQNGCVIFYCKDCQEIVDTERCGRKYVYKCKQCGTKNVAFGTKKSVYGFFKLDDKQEEEAPVKVELKGGKAEVAKAEVEGAEGEVGDGGDAAGAKPEAEMTAGPVPTEETATTEHEAK